MLDYAPPGDAGMGLFWTFWICGILAGIVAGKMGRRAWAWVLYGCLTGPLALFHVLMLAAIRIEREEAEARAAATAAGELRRLRGYVILELDLAELRRDRR